MNATWGGSEGSPSCPFSRGCGSGTWFSGSSLQAEDSSSIPGGSPDTSPLATTNRPPTFGDAPSLARKQTQVSSSFAWTLSFT